jgi:isopenicillin N synthase-like dioxygenase
VINFGEMMEIWTDGLVRATPHRVKGGDAERISVPLFFNPSWDTNVAPMGSDETIPAGEHLSRRFNETYVHLKK